MTIPSKRLGEAYDEDINKLNDDEIAKLWSFGDPNQLTVLYADEVVFEYRNGMDKNTYESGPGVSTYDFDCYGYEGETTKLGNVAATTSSSSSEVFNRVDQMPH